MMCKVENSAVDKAAEAMAKAMDEYRNAKSADDRRAAFARYKEASATYRTMLKFRYSL